MGSITMKGRKVPLIYTTWEMKEIQEELGPIGKAIKIVLGRNPEDEDDTSLYGSADQLKAAATMIRILGNAGLEENGEDPDLTDKKVLRALKPAELIEAINACMDAMNEGMSSEIPQKKKTGPVDVVLEEIEKKKERTD